MSLSRSAATSCSRLKPRAWMSRTASRAVVPALTTTSYAVLALLALQPWTTYQLARQMEPAAHWPHGWLSRVPGRCWNARPWSRSPTPTRGSRDGLLANLAALIDDTTAKLYFGQMIADAYLQGRGPFPNACPTAA